MLDLKNDKYELLYNKKISNEYAVKIERLKEGEKPSLLSDTMFKTMFQNSNRLKYSCKFLSYYLDISYEKLLKNIRLGKNELDKNNEKDKGRYCDYVANVNGTTINIEVNNNSNVSVMERNMKYAHRLYASKIKRKSDGGMDYTQVIQLNLNNFSFVGNDKIVDKYFIQNEDGIRLNNKLTFIQIYIPNLRKKCYNLGIDKLSEEERHILAFIEPDIKISKELGEGDHIMEEYIEEAVEVSGEEFFGESYDKEWALKDQGRREGIETGQREMIGSLLEQGVPLDVILKCTAIPYEDVIKIAEEEHIGESYDKEWALKDQGRREGYEEKTCEIALSLLDNGVDINIISKSTGLTIDEINELKKK